MRMILTAALALTAAPALAWEVTLGQVCTLSHSEAAGSMELTYDPRLPEYSITVRRPGGWDAGPVFAMRFEGSSPLTISTGRHRVAGDALTVTDSGFGNVLNGMGRNRTATAFVGDQAVTVSLAGVLPPLEAFRECAAQAGV